MKATQYQQALDNRYAAYRAYQALAYRAHAAYLTSRAAIWSSIEYACIQLSLTEPSL